MKKFFMFAAMASVAFASCVKNEPVVSVAEQAEIAFDAPLLAPAVKSVAETTTATLPNFKVWGYFTATAVQSFSLTFSDATALSNSLYMNGVEIGKDAHNIWKSTDKKYYWPVNGSLTFLACAPSSVANVSVASNGLNIKDYVVGQKADQDLLVSKVAYGVNKKDHANNGGAPIVFEHALSSILFKVKTTDDIVDNNYTLTVKKISLKGVVSTGSFAQKLDAQEHNMKPSTAENNGWTAGTTMQDYVAYENATGITLTKDLQSTTTGENLTDLILLPQVLTDDTEVEVVFTLKNATMTGNAIEQTLTAKLAQGSTQQWLRGKRYVYNLTIGLQEITFAPQVSPWVAGTIYESELE